MAANLAQEATELFEAFRRNPGMQNYFRSFIPALSLMCSVLPVAAARTGPVPGDQMVMVGKRQVHVLVEGHGRPAVILEAGFVNDLRSFNKIQPKIANLTTVVLYDRAGLGLSEPSSEGRSGEQIARDLHAVLAQLRISPPYVLVGHSAGGLYIRSFAHLYGSEVGGMVFVDAVLPSYLEWLKQNDQEHWGQLINIGMNSGEIVKAQWLGLEPTVADLRRRPVPSLPAFVLVSDEPDQPFKPPVAMREFLLRSANSHITFPIPVSRWFMLGTSFPRWPQIAFLLPLTGFLGALPLSLLC